MKTTLPKRSLVIKERLDRIVEEILKIRKGKIAMIILFGSYARGDWVSDEYVEDNITYTYQSDIDLLIILRKGNNGRDFALKMEDQIEKRLEYSGIENPALYKEPWVSLVIENIGAVNKNLEKGQYFFSDIKKEGVLLYDNEEFELAEVRVLSNRERSEIAQKDYNYWYSSGTEFFRISRFTLAEHLFSKTAFLLHQATESFYNAILLVFSGYKPKLHDIKKLRKRTNGYHRDLFKVFPLNTPDQRESFDLLRRAYIEARYSKDYEISKEQMEYLIRRIELLKKVTEQICLNRIRQYEMD